MKFDIHPRRTQVMRRLSKAVDRVIVAKTQADKDLAKRWAAAWAFAAGLRT